MPDAAELCVLAAGGRAGIARALGGGGGGIRGIERGGGGGGTRAGGFSIRARWYIEALAPRAAASSPRTGHTSVVHPPRDPLSLSRHRTFRWNDGRDVGSYEAVETSDEGLLWYRWSHAHGAEGGRQDEALQPFDAFLRDGPLRAAPAPTLAALRAWLDTNLEPR